MGKCYIEYLPLAYDDLDNIFDYIAAEDRGAAANLLKEIDEAVRNLEDFPDMGANPRPRRLAAKGYKMLIVSDYLVFYVVADDVVEIRRIVSSRQNYAKLL